MNYIDAVDRCGGIRAAARALGQPYQTVRKRYLKQRDAKPTNVIAFPRLPKKQQSAATLIKRLADDARVKRERRDAEKWFPIHVRDKRPIGMVWFGDPHLGSDTDWDTLNRDVATCVATPGLYAANLGDTTNNWTGRLTRLYAESDASRHTERALAKWFLAEAGLTWLVWLMGNHDEWEHGADLLRLMDVHNKVPMLDWSAKFELVFPNKRRVRINAAHDFPGNSMWNTTHAPSRVPRMLGVDADLFVCGHRHDWGIQQYEMSERGRCPVAVRARGYKVGDSYARRHGYQEAQHGQSVVTIIDPNAGPAGRVLAFADVAQGARVLSALRGGR